jgi:hypothetical protein
LQHVDEQPAPSAPLPRGQNQPSCNLARDSVGIADALFDLDDTEKRTHRVHTAVSGNPLLTMVHQSGVFDMEVLFCICPNAVSRDEQLLHAGLFPSSRKQIETTFTFSVLDDFLVDNLECKTTVQQYYSKLQHITNWMFPDHVSVCMLTYSSFPVLIRLCRTYINSSNRRLANGVTYRIGCKVDLGISMGMSLSSMDPWLYFALHAHSLGSTFRWIGRTNTHCMLPLHCFPPFD